MHVVFLIGMNVAVVLSLALVWYVANVSGTGFCLGFLIGLATFAVWFRLKHGYWP